MKLALVGVSHHRAPIELRERVAVDGLRATSLARSLARECEAVVLSTCNRTELYLAAGEHVRLGERAHGALLELAGDGGAELEPVVYELEDESAALHLFRVAAGLDSMVPGEGEILGQVRSAYEGGATGPFLERLFTMALHVGRRARVETAIGESPASVPAAAAALAQQVFGELTGRRVLIVGAGRMGELTARNLVSRGAEIEAVASRTPANATSLAARLGAAAIPLERIASSLDAVDMVVCCTSASGFVVHAHDAGDRLRARRGRPLLLLDLAVPRDVDPALTAFDGCYVYDVDDLEAIVATTLEGRRAEAVEAERIVAAEADRFREWQASLVVVPAIASLRTLADEIRTRELARVEGRLGRLPAADRDLVETITAQIVNKLLHLPTVRMKEAAVTADGVIYAEVVRHLFGLDENGARPTRDEADS